VSIFDVLDVHFVNEMREPFTIEAKGGRLMCVICTTITLSLLYG
jgi:hypothetical protein